MSEFMATMSEVEEPQHTGPEKPLFVQAPNPALESAFHDAKSFLKKSMTSAENGTTSLYDHLTQVLVRILQQRPANPTDIIEQVSADIKKLKLSSNPRAGAVPPTVKVEKFNDKVMQDCLALVQRAANSGKDAMSDVDSVDLPDIVGLSHLFEAAGVSFGTTESHLIAAAVKELATLKQFKSARLFGKVFGVQCDYIIVESELQENEQPEEPAADGQSTGTAVDGDSVAPVKLPVATPPPVPHVAKEQPGKGLNKYVYWVCSYAGAEWTRLPDVEPKFIQQSRHLRKMMTGNLKARITSYPSFDGIEADYLRCQIARISSASVVSPSAYYQVDEDDEAEDEADRQVILNADFEWPTQETLLQLDSWTHHQRYILPQGRTTFVSPIKKRYQENEEGSQDGDAEETEPETGPPVLTPLSEDSFMDGDISAWTATLISSFGKSRHVPAMLRCNRWPGAVTVCQGQKFANIYVGWGLKDQTNTGPLESVGLVPPALSPFQTEYAEHLIEQNDPSLQEEQAYAETFRQAAEAKAAEELDAAKGDESEEEEDA